MVLMIAILSVIGTLVETLYRAYSKALGFEKKYESKSKCYTALKIKEKSALLGRSFALLKICLQILVYQLLTNSHPRKL